VKLDASSHTSVLMAKVGFQPSGGTILTMPYLLPSGAILRMYSIGSLNSSSVGKYVGASGMPNNLFFFGCSGGMFGWPLRSTVDRSSGSARRALRGMAWLLPDGGPFSVPGTRFGVAVFILDGAVGVLAPGEALLAEAVGTVGGAPLPTLGVATMASNIYGRKGPEWRVSSGDSDCLRRFGPGEMVVRAWHERRYPSAAPVYAAAVKRQSSGVRLQAARIEAITQDQSVHATPGSITATFGEWHSAGGWCG
jgi:hypothetical protein